VHIAQFKLLNERFDVYKASKDQHDKASAGSWGTGAQTPSNSLRAFSGVSGLLASSSELPARSGYSDSLSCAISDSGGSLMSSSHQFQNNTSGPAVPTQFISDNSQVKPSLQSNSSFPASVQNLATQDEGHSQPAGVGELRSSSYINSAAKSYQYKSNTGQFSSIPNFNDTRFGYSGLNLPAPPESFGSSSSRHNFVPSSSSTQKAIGSIHNTLTTESDGQASAVLSTQQASGKLNIQMQAHNSTGTRYSSPVLTSQRTSDSFSTIPSSGSQVLLPRDSGHNQMQLAADFQSVQPSHWQYQLQQLQQQQLQQQQLRFQGPMNYLTMNDSNSQAQRHHQQQLQLRPKAGSVGSTQLDFSSGLNRLPQTGNSDYSNNMRTGTQSGSTSISSSLSLPYAQQRGGSNVQLAPAPNLHQFQQWQQTQINLQRNRNIDFASSNQGAPSQQTNLQSKPSLDKQQTKQGFIKPIPEKDLPWRRLMHGVFFHGPPYEPEKGQLPVMQDSIGPCAKSDKIPPSEVQKKNEGKKLMRYIKDQLLLLEAEESKDNSETSSLKQGEIDPGQIKSELPDGVLIPSSGLDAALQPHVAGPNEAEKVQLLKQEFPIHEDFKSLVNVLPHTSLDDSLINLAAQRKRRCPVLEEATDRKFQLAMLRGVPRQRTLLNHLYRLNAWVKRNAGGRGGLSSHTHSSLFGGGGPHLADPSLFARSKKQTKTDIKRYEREQQRLKQEREAGRRHQYQLYLRSVMAHRDEFVKFHRTKRTDVARAARAVRTHVETLEKTEEKIEDREARKRIQALRANDMEAYAELVNETKNERLQFLLKQTDEYIAQISHMISESREKAQEEQEESAAERAALRGYGVGRGGEQDLSGGGASNFTGTAYLSSTHQQREEVRQPSMLMGGDLKEYQLAGLQWLISLYNNNLNGILADEMGLGKTIQSIALLCYLIEVKHNHGPFLICVPLSTMSNWVNEFTKWGPDIIVVAYKGAPNERKMIYKEEMESGQYNVILTTYEYIIKDRSILRKIFWQYIIVDEGHRMKNAKSKFAQTLGLQYQSKHRVLLTGTPLQNNLPELWALLNFLLPSIFNSVETFDQWFSQPFSKFGGAAATADGSEENELLSTEERLLIINRLHTVLRPFMLRRVKSAVLDQLPDKVERVVRCELSGWQRKMYKDIQTRGSAILMDGQGQGVRGLNNVIMQLRKLCNHPYLFLTDAWPLDDDLWRSSGKFELLDRLLPKLKLGGHRVLMFSQMTQVMSLLEDYFQMRGFRFLRLDGSTSAEDREQRMFQFNAPDSPYFIFLLSTRAGGLGLNLATADAVILFDSDWNTMADMQAQDRAHRIGQKNEVRVLRLVTNSPVEEKILSRATEKLNINELVVEAGKFNKDSKEHERRAMMQSLLRDWDENESDEEESQVPDDEQLNELLAITPSEFDLYQKNG